MKKNHLLLTAIVLALVLCFSCGAFAADITSDKDNPNQYLITEKLQSFNATDDLWIGTLADWKAEGKKVGDTGTFFENGEAIHNDDIIITNGKVGIVLAVGTRNPWGYPAGSVLDAGTVKDNVGGRDTIWSAEVLVDGWDSWAPDNCGTVTFDVVKYDFDAKKEVATGGLDAVKVSRVYDIKEMSFDIVTYYGIAPGTSYAYMFDQFTNKDAATKSLSNRFAMTNKGDDGGAMYGGSVSSTTGAYSGMVACYGKTDKNVYFTGLIMPGNVERINAKTGENIEGIVEPSRTGGSVGYKCVRVDSKGNFNGGADYSKFDANEQRTYNSYIYIGSESNPQGALDLIADIEKAEVINVAGTTTPNATIVVKVDGKTFGWYEADKDGKFSFKLPKTTAEYTAYVETSGKINGETVTIPADGTDSLALTAGTDKVKVTLNVKDTKGNALFAKVEVPNLYPTVRYNGNSIFIAKEAGKVELEVAPGETTAVIYGQGHWFYSNPVTVDINTAQKTAYDVIVDMKYTLDEGWLAADLHHHANKNDAFADPKDAIPAMKAAGLDVAFVTDHDFTVNNAKAYELAKEYNMAGFIPSEEISCSWAHFNVIPLNEESYAYFKDDKAENHVMNQFEKLPDFVAQTHEHGAAITANHPWYSYGLFYADYNDAIAGDYTDDYDNIELNACCADDENLETILSGIDLWTAYTDAGSVNNQGDAVTTKKPHYIVGGSDTHDVLYPGFAANDYTNPRAAVLPGGDGTLNERVSSPQAVALGYSSYTSGKIRTMAYIGEETNDITKNGLAFAHAVVDGNSYTTYGPLLDIDAKALPGEYYNDAKFSVSFDVKSLAKIEDILVLTEYADTNYDDFGVSLYKGNYLKYDAEASKLHVNSNEATFTYEAEVPKGEFSWVAFLVVDENGNFAITNPYWIANTFSDVDLEAWYAQAITTVQQAGLINGYPDGTFKPEANITRAEFANIMFKMISDGEKATEKAGFSDVNDNHWAKDAIDFLAQENIINGYPDGTFKPDTQITRAEIAQILYKALDLDEFTKHFKDVEAGVWYYDAVTALGTIGVVNGYPDNTFLPNNNARRCEVAQIIANLINMN